MAESIGNILDQYKAVIDEREKVAARDKELSKRKTELEREILAISERDGVNQFANEYISITVNEDARATYDPELWEGIVKWAVESNNIGLLYRQMSSAKLKAMIEEGVALPPGLSTEPFKKVAYRRK